MFIDILNQARRTTHRPSLEPLEDRQLLSTCHVVRLGDFGAGGDLGGGHSRGDLRYCINKANNAPGADTVLLQVTGTITLTGPLPDLASDMDIQGPGSGLLTIRRDTGGDYRLFTIAGNSVTISGVSLANGRADVGGGVYNQGTLHLSEVAVSSNTSTGGFGGGIYNAGELTLAGVTISDNEAKSNDDEFNTYGGGIYNAGTISMLSGAVLRNYASGYGEGYGGGIYNSGDLTIDGSVLSDNATRSYDLSFGGGLYNTQTVAINSSIISNNQTTGASELASWRGAGGGVFNAGVMSFTDSTIAGNVAYPRNGALGNSYGASGGGAYNAGVMSFIDSTIAGNLAYIDKSGSDTTYAYGGGIRSVGTLTIANSAITGNTSHAEDSGSDFTLAFGGGISLDDGDTTIVNSTIAQNAAFAYGGFFQFKRGGGVFQSGSGTLSISYSTIANNTCSDGSGGGLYGGDTSQLNLSNSIIANNSANSGPDIFGSSSSSGYNLFGNSAGGSGYAPTDILNVDPLLGPLQDNGGPTQTMALLPGSPAIDAGDQNPTDPPDWDQRGPGFPRIVNGRIDIGAFEVQATGAPPSKNVVALITADFQTMKAKRRR